MSSRTSIAPRLVIIEGKDKGKVISLADGTAVLGRSKGDILIQDARISRSHVALHFDNRTGKLTFTDLKSLNGTLINGEKAESGELHDGDKLQLGNTTIDCQLMVDDGKSQITSQTIATAREREPKIEIPAEAHVFRRQEPTLGPQSHEKTAATRLQKQNRAQSLFSAYRKLPPKVRYAALASFALVLLLKTSKTPTTGTAINDLESDLKFVRTLQSDGKLDEAIAKIDAIKQRNPQNAQVYMELGNVYAAQEKNELAISAFQRAHALPPELPLIHIKLIRIYLRMGMTKEASEELGHVEQLIKEGKHSKELFVEAAFLFLEFKELKQPPEKTIILAKALQKEYAPESTIGYKLEAQVYFQENHPAEALTIMNKARQIDGTDEWLLENVVFANLALKQVADAEKILDDWIRLKPDGTKPLLVYAYLRFNEGSSIKALPYVQKILQIGNMHPKDPYYPEGLHLMAQIHQQLNQPDEAVKFFHQSCELGFKQSCKNDLNRESAGRPGPAKEMKNLVAPEGATNEEALEPPTSVPPQPEASDDPTLPSE